MEWWTSLLVSFAVALFAETYANPGRKEVSVCHEQRDNETKLSCRRNQPISILEVRQFVYSDVILPNSSCCATTKNGYRCSFGVNSTSYAQKICINTQNTDGRCKIKISDVLGNVSACGYTVIVYSCNVLRPVPEEVGRLTTCAPDLVCQPLPGGECGEKAGNSSGNKDIKKKVYTMWIVVGVVVVVVLTMIVVVVVCCLLLKRRRKFKTPVRRSAEDSNGLAQNGGSRAVNYADIAFEPENIVISNYSDVSVAYASVNKLRNSTNVNADTGSGYAHESVSLGQTVALDTDTQNNNPKQMDKFLSFSNESEMTADATNGGFYDHMPDRSLSTKHGENVKKVRKLGDAEAAIPQASDRYLYDHIPLRVSEFCDNTYDTTQTVPENSLPNYVTKSAKREKAGNSSEPEPNMHDTSSVNHENGPVSNRRELRSEKGDNFEATYDRLECKKVKKTNDNDFVNSEHFVRPRGMDKSNDYSLEDLTRHIGFDAHANSPTGSLGYEYPSCCK